MRLLYTIAACLVVLSLNAQSSSKASFREAVDHYQSELGINFSFDSDVLDQISKNHIFDTSDLDSFIKEANELLAIEIEAVDDKYYTIRTAVSNYLLTTTDSIDNQPIPTELGTYVLVNVQPIRISVVEAGWKFSYKPVITDTLQVFSLGYSRKTLSFQQLLNSKALSVKLSPVVVQLAGLSIEDYLTKGIDLNPSSQSVNISVRDLPLLPGETDGDIFAAITALPGVTTPDGRAGNLFIRGSETDQTLILFDNIPIYHRGHYYGTISPYNPKIVDNVEVYRSGFHPRLGDRVGGAVIINSDQNPPPNPIIGAAFNSLYGSAYVKVPLANDRLGISFGARRSYPRNFQSPKLNTISESVFAATGVLDTDGNIATDIDVLFEDYHGKIIFQADERNRLSFSTIYTNTDVFYYAFPPIDAPQVPEDNQFKNLGFNLDWSSEFQNNWKSSFSATFSDYKFTFNTGAIGEYPLTILSSNDLKNFNLKQEFSTSSPGMFSYQIGLDYKWQEVLTDFYRLSLKDGKPFTLNSAISSHSLSPYANIEYQGSEKLYAQLGVRSTYYSNLSDFKIAPRLMLNYEAGEWLILKASSGLYNQYLSQARNLEFGGGGFDNELWMLADDKEAGIIEGTQSMAGFIANQSEWIVDVEAYYKTVNNITVFEDRQLQVSRETFTMDQKAYGLDVMLKRQLNENASLWVGYSYNESEIQIDTTDLVMYQSKYVQPHVWYVGSSLKTQNLKLSATWNYSSGLNAESLDIIYAEIIRLRNIANLPPGAGPSPPDPFEDLPERYPNIHMLNISASYKIPRTKSRKWEATFGLSLINVFDQKNLTDRVFRGRDGFVDRNALGFAPNLMVGVEF